MGGVLVEEIEPTFAAAQRSHAAGTVVLHIIDPGSPGGGACTLHLLADLIRTLPEIDHRVMIVGDSQHVELARRCGLSPDGWMCPVRNLPMSGCRDLRRYVHAMLASGTQVDLLHAWTPRTSILARLVAPNIPQLLTLQVGPMPGLTTRYWMRLMHREPSPVLASTADIARECRRLGLGSTSVSLMPAAVEAQTKDLVDRASIRRRWHHEHGIAPDAFIVGLLAEPISWPDLLTSATSVGRVNLSGRPVKLLVHEKVMHRVEAERFVNHLQLGEILIFDDALAEPWQIVAGLDAALWGGPRRQRPSPSILPILWAMAASTPVIAECTDDAQHLIDDGINGFLIDPHDVNAASHSILRLFDDRALARGIGGAANAHVRDSYEISAYAVRMKHAYELLLAKKRRSQAAAPVQRR
jgi:glycosyltransferase involved in cell wall biosynthesis